RLEKGRLLFGRHDVDTLPAAYLFTQLASDTGAFIHFDLAEVSGSVVVGWVDTIEGAHVDAHATSVAVVGMHDGNRALRLLEHVRYIAKRVEDGLVRADHAARAAVDAQRRLDVERQARLTADGFCRAPFLARRTAGTVLGNDGKWHSSAPRRV